MCDIGSLNVACVMCVRCDLDAISVVSFPNNFSGRFRSDGSARKSRHIAGYRASSPPVRTAMDLARARQGELALYRRGVLPNKLPRKGEATASVHRLGVCDEDVRGAIDVALQAVVGALTDADGALPPEAALARDSAVEKITESFEQLSRTTLACTHELSAGEEENLKTKLAEQKAA